MSSSFFSLSLSLFLSLIVKGRSTSEAYMYIGGKVFSFNGCVLKDSWDPTGEPGSFFH